MTNIIEIFVNVSVFIVEKKGCDGSGRRGSHATIFVSNQIKFENVCFELRWRRYIDQREWKR